MLAPFALILKTKSGSLIPREDPATKSDEFLKNSKRPLPRPPPLIFGKLCCNFFTMDLVAFMQGGIGQIVSVDIETIVEKIYLET